jgi:hypothetical protein
MKTGNLPFLSKKVFFLLFLLSSATPAQEPPKVTLERMVDGRGNRVCDVARAELKAEGVRRAAWVVRGLVKSDLVLALETIGPASLNEIGLKGRPVLRFARSAAGGRVTATSLASEFRYFDADLPSKTVRCNLTRLADETDPDLLAAASDYGLLKQGLENGASWGPEELPVVALLAAKKSPPHPSPPYRRSVPWTEGGPEADDLAAAARAVIAR